MPIIQAIQDMVWAIHPAKLDEIVAFIEGRFNTEDPFDPKEQLAASGSSGNRADDSYEIVDGVAVIPVMGTLMKRANLFSRWSGGTSYQLIARDMALAAEDPNAEAILLLIDSPGGTADGIVEASEAIMQARARKPVIALADGSATSAAQWLASAANLIVASPTTLMGSIGVVSVHLDLSERDKKAGIKRTEIVSGRYKRMASDTGPLTDDALAYLQERSDYYYGLFLDGVATGRGVDVERVLAMADGKIYVGQQAVDIGLADRIGTQATAMRLARELAGQRKGQTIMTAEELREKFPEVWNAVFQAGAKSVNLDAAVAEATNLAAKAATTAAVASERDRVVQILEKGSDHPAAALKAVKEGISMDSAGWVFLEAEKAAKATALAKFEAQAPESAGHSAQAKDSEAGGKAFMDRAREVAKEQGCSLSDAMSRVAAMEPDLHAAFRAACEKKAGKTA